MLPKGKINNSFHLDKTTFLALTFQICLGKQINKPVSAETPKQNLAVIVIKHSVSFDIPAEEVNHDYIDYLLAKHSVSKALHYWTFDGKTA